MEKQNNQEVTELVYDALEKIFDNFARSANDVLNIADKFSDKEIVRLILGEVMAGQFAPEKLARLQSLITAADVAQLSGIVLKSLGRVENKENDTGKDFAFLIEDPRGLNQEQLERLILLLGWTGTVVESVGVPGSMSVFIKAPNGERLTRLEFANILRNGGANNE